MNFIFLYMQKNNLIIFIKAKSVKHIEENVGENLHDLRNTKIYQLKQMNTTFKK